MTGTTVADGFCLATGLAFLPPASSRDTSECLSQGWSCNPDSQDSARGLYWKVVNRGWGIRLEAQGTACLG